MTIPTVWARPCFNISSTTASSNGNFWENYNTYITCGKTVSMWLITRFLPCPTKYQWLLLQLWLDHDSMEAVCHSAACRVSAAHLYFIQTMFSYLFTHIFTVLTYFTKLDIVGNIIHVYTIFQPCLFLKRVKTGVIIITIIVIIINNDTHIPL